MTWWEEYPGREQWEREHLEAAGFDTKKEVRDVEAGRLVFELHIPDGLGGLARLLLTYGPFFPDTPPTLELPDKYRGRHVADTVCVLEDPGGRDWHEGRSGAGLVELCVQMLHQRSRGDVTRDEAPMVEPASAFLQSALGAVVVPDPLWHEELTSDLPEQLQMAAIRTNALSVVVTGYLGAGLDGVAALAQRRRGRVSWLKVEALRPDTTLYDIRDQVGDDNFKRACRMGYNLDPSGPMVPKGLRASRGDGKFKKVRLILLTFIEEGPRRGQRRRAWAGMKVGIARGAPPEFIGWLSGQRLSVEERQVRAPGHAGIETKSVVVLGAGSLGGAVTTELAKAGVCELAVVDDDNYDVGNAVRHVLPTTLAGWPKAAAVAAEAERLNPFIDVESHLMKLGRSRDLEMEDAVRAADLVIDTTGSDDASRVLSLMRHAVGRPYLIANVGYGARGSSISIHQGTDWCFVCLQLYVDDDPALAAPADPLPDERVTPAGCSHPTFTGSGVEATAVAAAVARTALRVLGAADYPMLEGNLILEDLREERRERRQLPEHPRCNRHAEREGA